MALRTFTDVKCVVRSSPALVLFSSQLRSVKHYHRIRDSVGRGGIYYETGNRLMSWKLAKRVKNRPADRPGLKPAPNWAPNLLFSENGVSSVPNYKFLWRRWNMSASVRQCFTRPVTKNLLGYDMEHYFFRRNIDRFCLLCIRIQTFRFCYFFCFSFVQEKLPMCYKDILDY